MGGQGANGTCRTRTPHVLFSPKTTPRRGRSAGLRHVRNRHGLEPRPGYRTSPIRQIFTNRCGDLLKRERGHPSAMAATRPTPGLCSGPRGAARRGAVRHGAAQRARRAPAGHGSMGACLSEKIRRGNALYEGAEVRGARRRGAARRESAARARAAVERRGRGAGTPQGPPVLPLDSCLVFAGWGRGWQGLVRYRSGALHVALCTSYFARRTLHVVRRTCSDVG